MVSLLSVAAGQELLGKEKLSDTGRQKANVCGWYTTAKITYADHSGLNNHQG